MSLCGLPVAALAARPEFVVGGEREAPGNQLESVTGVGMLSDGRVALLDAGAKEVVLFGADGRLAGRMGGEGRGPGEFSAPTGLVVDAADRVHVWETQGRLTTFASSGSVIETRQVRTAPLSLDRTWQLVDVHDDGSWIVWGLPRSSGWTRAEVPPIQEGLFRDDARVVRIDSRGRGAMVYTGPGMILRGRPERGGVAYESVLGSPLPIAVADGDEILVGAGDSQTLLRVASNGDTTATMTLDLTTRPMADSDLAVLKHIRASTTRERAAILTRMGASGASPPMPDDAPETLPYFDKALADPTGPVWIRMLFSPADSVQRWVVLDGGAAMSTVQLDARLQLRAVRQDRVTVSSTGSLGLVTLAVYRLRPAEPLSN